MHSLFYYKILLITFLTIFQSITIQLFYQSSEYKLDQIFYF